MAIMAINSRGIFPQWMIGVSDTIDFCCTRLDKPGIYCIEYPSTLDEEMREIVCGIFSSTRGSFFHYTGYENFDMSKLDEIKKDKIRRRLKGFNAPILYGEFNQQIRDFIDSNIIKRESDKELKIIIKNIDGKMNELEIVIDGVVQSVVNESYRTLIYAIIATNTILQTDRPICYMLDISRLDNEFIDFIINLFKYINPNLMREGKYIILLFSDEKKNSYFADKYLWSASPINNFAIVGENGARKLSSYNESKIHIDMLAKHIKEKGTISLHLGAGASYTSGIPSTEHMLIMALKELLGINEDNVKILTEKFCEIYNYKSEEITFELVMSRLKEKTSLNSTLVLKDFREKLKNAKSSPGYVSLSELSSKYRIIISTTNIDNLSEQSINGNKIVLFDEAKYLEALSERVLEDKTTNIVAKLHGDVNKTPNYLGILLETNMKLKPNIKKFYESFLQGKHTSNEYFYLTFIGYGFGDKDVLDVLEEEGLKQTSRFTPIIISPCSGEKIEKFIKRIEHKESSSNPLQINMTFDKFMVELNNQL
jgi:hypothetical protein